MVLTQLVMFRFLRGAIEAGGGGGGGSVLGSLTLRKGLDLTIGRNIK